MSIFASKGRYSRNKPEQFRGPVATILDYLHDIVYLLAGILLVFTFLVRVVVVDGKSMYDTLIHGDYLLLLNSPLCGELEQGDIVVASVDRFRNGAPIVKRVIATEGQTVDIDFGAGVVYVDGVALDESYTFTPTTNSEGMQFPLVVSEGCVFLMGDNRGDSLDSRSPSIGLVDEREVLGQALFLIFPGEDYDGQREFSRIGGLE